MNLLKHINIMGVSRFNDDLYALNSGKEFLASLKGVGAQSRALKKPCLIFGSWNQNRIKYFYIQFL